MFDDLQIPFLYEIPLIWAGIGFAAVLFLVLELGYRVGLARRRRLKSSDAGGGGIALTAMLALLGLLLAFTYSFTVNRFEHRKAAVVAEANALGTAYLRAGLVEGPEAQALQDSIRRYAGTRYVGKENWESHAQAIQTIEESVELQSRLWPLTRQLVQSKQPGAIEASIVSAVNAVIDNHTQRIMASVDRLPQMIFWMLIVVAAASLSVAGFNAGLAGFMSRWRVSALTVVLAVVILVIVDLDRPVTGFIRVSQEPLKWAIEAMKPPGPGG